MVQTLFGPQKEQKDPQKEKSGIFDRLKKAVASTKAQLVERIDEIVEGRTEIDQSVLDELEATLITADLGVKTTQAILAGLRERINRRQLREPKQLREATEQASPAISEIVEILLREMDRPPDADVLKKPPASEPQKEMSAASSSA